jgi:hypothetical protein
MCQEHTVTNITELLAWHVKGSGVISAQYMTHTVATIQVRYNVRHDEIILL